MVSEQYQTPLQTQIYRYLFYNATDFLYCLSYNEKPKGMIEMNLTAKVEIKVENKTVTAHLSGEIDHHNAEALRRRIDEAVNNRLPELLVLDFGAVSFMDSSGIGLVMGRYRLIENMNCRLYIINLSGHAYKVMKLAGLEKIAVLQEKKKEANTI